MLSQNDELPKRSLLFVIFGGTGDLTHRKLLPALYHLTVEARLPAEYSIIAVGRREKTSQIYRGEAKKSIASFSRSHVDENHIAAFLQRIHYQRVEFDLDQEGYQRLAAQLNEVELTFTLPCERIFFLAVAPEYFGVIIERLKTHDLIEKSNPDHRVMIEKPFGSDLATARTLNQSITEVLDEHQIFRIDHYLGKEMIQNILAIRFGNSLFEPLWNQNYIDHIQITSTEILGVESRGGYYDQSGIMKDMLQSHLLQMLALITMEPPIDLSPESVRDEKVKALRALRRFDKASATAGIVRGQYGSGKIDGQEVVGYRQEDRVATDSDTLTYIALKTCVDNFRWGGVPIYIRTGKRLDRRRTQIVIEFKKLPGVNFYPEFKDLNPNLLVIEVQPTEGMYFQINAKRPGNEFAMERVELNYCQNCRYQGNVPEAYERLILEAFRGNSSLFTRWDELEYSWAFIESIETAFSGTQELFPNYAAGSRGPEAADRLINADGRRWWEIDLP
jgi:glucose-6-phosphate 1-dehydrogenase